MSKGSTPLVLPAAFVILVLVAFPFGYAVWMSLTNHTVGSSRTDFVGFSNYIRWFSRPEYWQTILNTLIFAGSTVVFGLSSGSPSDCPFTRSSSCVTCGEGPYWYHGSFPRWSAF